MATAAGTTTTKTAMEMAMMFHQIRQFLRRQVYGCGCVVVFYTIAAVAVVVVRRVAVDEILLFARCSI